MSQKNSSFKGWRNSLFYILLIGGAIGFAYYIVHKGMALQPSSVVPKVSSTTDFGWTDFTDATGHNLIHPLAILLLQIVTIIVAAAFMGYLFRKLRQPAVIGEILAGVILGPSLVGSYFPEFSAFLFPKASLSNLQFLSQIGLILFMFVVGMELDLKVLKNKAHEAVVISHASIVIPFTLGMGLAYFLYAKYAPSGINFISFSLFTGIAMSITAFPVLARIVQERQMTKSRIGALVITCAAADDITAWCLLAAVIAIVKAGSFISAIYTIALAVLYVLMMMYLVQPFLKRLGDKYTHKGVISKPMIGSFFITLLLSSYLTEVIGIHALFGAFLAGVIMPANANFRSLFIEKVEDVAVVLLLPLFFVFTGLRTQIGLLDNVSLWQACGAIIAVAVMGKFFGSTVAAKFVGQSWQDSLTIGALMNTRGLMELVVLNIGYDLGVLTPEIFAMMVIMALVTTFMTGPSMDIINYFFRDKASVNALEMKPDDSPKFKILIPFGTANSGRIMLKLAACFVRKSPETTAITTLHLTPSSQVNPYNIETVEKEIYQSVIEESELQGLAIDRRFKPSQDIIPELVRIANEQHCDLMLVGTSSSIFQGTLLGNLLGFTSRLIEPEKLFRTLTFQQGVFNHGSFDGPTQDIIDNSKVPVGIFVNKSFEDARQVIIPLYSISDQLLFIYAKKLLTNNNATLTLVDIKDISSKAPEIGDDIKRMADKNPDRVNIIKTGQMEEQLLQHYDLLLVSYSSWSMLTDQKAAWLKEVPSTLIIKP